MIIDARKRFGTNAVKYRNLKANGASSSNKVAKTKSKILAFNGKINLAVVLEEQAPEPDRQINPAKGEGQAFSIEFKGEINKIEAGRHKAPRHSCQQNSKALRASYGVICLRSLDIANYFYKGFFSYENWQEPNFNQLMTEIQQPLLKGLTELSYDYPDYEPIVDYLLKINESLIELNIEPEHYERLTKRLLAALRKGVAEYWTREMEQAWERVLGESYVFLQKRNIG